MVTRDEVAWQPGHNGEQYDVARESLGGQFGSCLASETAMTSCPDAETPLPGEVFGYLVRPTNVCGVGTWGSGSDGQGRAATCP